MCIRDRPHDARHRSRRDQRSVRKRGALVEAGNERRHEQSAVSYTHLRAHETVLDLVCRLLLEKKK